MLKICPGKFYKFIEWYKNLLKTYINYDKTPLLFVDKANEIVSTLLQYIKELIAQAAFAYQSLHFRPPVIVLPAAKHN